MAIQIGGTTVIDNSRNIINVVGIGSTTSILYGDGSNLTGIKAGGSGDFNTGITSTVQINPVGFASTAFTFPSTAGKRYVLESINVSNVSTYSEINFTGSVNFNNGQDVFYAYNIPIINGGSVELIKNPIVVNPGDALEMYTLDNNLIGISSIAQVYVAYSEQNTSYFGTGVGIATTATVGVFTSTGSPSTIETIRVTNRTDAGGYPVSVSITNGITTTFLVKGLIVPRYASVDICDRPKRIEAGGVIRVQTDVPNTIDVFVSGKTIS